MPDTDHKTIVKEPKLKDFTEKLNFVLEKTHKELDANSNRNGKPASASLNEKVNI